MDEALKVQVDTLAKSVEELWRDRDVMKLSIEDARDAAMSHSREALKDYKREVRADMNDMQSRNDRSYDKLEKRMDTGFENVDDRLKLIEGCIHEYSNSNNQKHQQTIELIQSMHTESIKSDAGIKIDAINSDSKQDKEVSKKESFFLKWAAGSLLSIVIALIVYIFNAQTPTP